MEFYFETLYDHAALTAMAKALRKVLRRKKSLLMRLFGFFVVLMGLFLSTPLGGRELTFSARSLISYITLISILLAILFEDSINGYVAQKRLPSGGEEVIATFHDDGYEVRTDEETTHWDYRGIRYLAETRYYFVLIFSENHAQVFDKDNISEETEDEFRSFISEKTGKEIKRV